MKTLLKREILMIFALTLIIGLVAAFWMHQHTPSESIASAWLSGPKQMLEVLLATVGFTTWIFLALLPLLPWGLATRSTMVLCTLATLATMTGTLGTVVGAADILGSFKPEAGGILANITFIRHIFISTAAGLVIAKVTYAAAMMVGLDLHTGVDKMARKEEVTP